MATIDFSEEQTMLLETAVDFCRKHSPLDRVRAQIDQQDSADPAIWQEMVDLGWLGITIAEAYGGLGLSLADVVPIAESMGRHLMGSAFIPTTVATQALIASGSEAQKEQWLPAIAAGASASLALTEEDGNWNLMEIGSHGQMQGNEVRLTAKKNFVLDASQASMIIVSANINGSPRLILVQADQLPEGALMRETVIDETRRSFTLELNDLALPVDQVLEGADFAAIEQAALLMLSAEMSGGLSGVLHVIIDYLTTRKQFDQYIGSYQSLKHPTVQILLSMEACRSHLYRAATCIAQGKSDETEAALRMAKAQGSEAFAFAGDRAVQFHGGFGFTYECDAQLFLRRALWCQYQFGDAAYHRNLLAPLLLDESVA
jgi:alkylation response protein AidB-like acyl-CoA dehydrogenase